MVWAAGSGQRVVFPPSAKPIGPYSPGIFAGEFLYVSGQGARGPGGQFPATFEDFRSYVDTMLSASGPVQVDERARELGRFVLRPKVRLVPGGAMIPFEIVTAGLLPAGLREQYGLKWGRGHERFFRLVVKALPRLIAVTPPILRVWPLPGHDVKLAANLSLTSTR